MTNLFRTHANILRDALERIQEHDSLEHRCIKCCATDMIYCKDCKQDISNDNPREDHADDCRYYSLLEELMAWIRVEEEFESKFKNA